MSDALDVARTAREAGWLLQLWCSAGESEETFLADIAVGVGADAILTGAPRGAEHCSKLNQVRCG